jgi:hypothetical protein
MKKVRNQVEAFKLPELPSYREVWEEVNGPKLPADVLLVEIDDLLRTRPPLENIANMSDEALGWIGRFKAVIETWDSTKAVWVVIDGNLQSQYYKDQAYHAMLSLLNQARASLRLRAAGTAFVIDGKKPHDYFQALRKTIEAATSEVFFVDQFLDAEFAGRYLDLVPTGVKIRLLGDRYVNKLAPAVAMFVAQTGASVAIRRAEIHERYLFVDGARCVTSGASFKDGAKYTPTHVIELPDLFDELWKKYNGMWAAANVIR